MIRGVLSLEFGTAEKQPQIEKGSEVEVEIAINLSIQAPKRFVFSVFVNFTRQR